MDDVLDPKERKKLISLLKGLSFDHLDFNDHMRKHGMNKENLRSIFPQFDKIVDVTVRTAKDGDKSCFVYKINKSLTYYLIFRLDRKPKELFNAYIYRGNVEDRLKKKYFSWLKRR